MDFETKKQPTINLDYVNCLRTERINNLEIRKAIYLFIQSFCVINN